MFAELLHIINRSPNNTWNKYLSRFFGPYDGSKDHDITSLVFYWRELFHFLGGVIVGLILLPLFLFLPNLIAALLPIAGTGIVIGLKEFLGDAPEQENGWDFKNVVDTAAWTAGTMAISLGIYFLIR